MSEDERIEDSLNEFQAGRLKVTCQYIDGLLSEIEQILAAEQSKAAFPRYTSDISPAQRQAVEEYISRVRAQLVRALEGQGLARERASIPASRAVHVTLGAIDIAAEELKPRYMRGYGEVPKGAAAKLNDIAGELQSLVHRLDRHLADGTAEHLGAPTQQRNDSER